MIDLAEAAVLDVHCHPWRRDDLLAQEPGSFEDRTTMMGMCQLTSGQGSRTRSRVAELSESTPLALALRRRLAGFLGCPPGRGETALERARALSEDPSYVPRLFADAGLAGLICDEGYPQPAVDLRALEEQVGTSVYRVGRIEPWIDELVSASASHADLEERFTETLEREADDPSLVAFKSVIAYRTGLDVGNQSIAEAEAAFARRDGDRRASEKAVRDRLLRRTLEVAARRDRPVHIHCGGGDPDVVLQHARPSDLFPLLSEFKDQPIVLIHSGWPWIEEAAYIASILPNVHLDVSVMLPWASLAIDQKLEVLLGAAPAGKVMYGSDEASEPEVIWFAARIGREAVQRVLGRAVAHDWLTEREANDIGRGFLSGNAARLHGIETGVGAAG